MRIVAQGPSSAGGEMRVCAVVIALSECSNLGGLSSLSVFAANRRAKPKNTIDAGARRPHSGSSMSRTPNAIKSIFAFVARISLR
jgi:hypothetical protein